MKSLIEEGFIGVDMPPLPDEIWQGIGLLQLTESAFFSTSSDTLTTWSIPEEGAITTQGENRCNGIIRWYDPITGRWCSNDPIGISGGLNMYQAFLSNPVNFIDPDGLDVYKINVSYTTYWAVDTPGGGVEMYHYSGKSWNQGSGQWRVFWKDQAEVGRFQDPSAFLQEYFPDMPRTPDSVRKLADSWRGKRYKKTCDEDAAVLQKFQEAEKNEANLFYNAFGIGGDNCFTFGQTIMKQAQPPTIPK